MDITTNLKKLIKISNDIKKKNDELDEYKKERNALIKSLTKDMIDSKTFTVEMSNHTAVLETKFVLSPMYGQINRLHKNLIDSGYGNLVSFRIDTEQLNKLFNSSLVSYDAKGQLNIPAFLKGLVTVSENNYITIINTPVPEAIPKKNKKNAD